MEFGKGKMVLDILMAAFVLISLGISAKSCRVAENARKIAGDSLETSRYQFIQINRPYIILCPKRYKNGLFWKVKQHDNTVVIDLQFEIKNVGNVSAKNISLPNEFSVGPKIKLSPNAVGKYIKPDKVTLGPGDELIAAAKFILEYGNEEEAQINLEHIVSGKSEGVTMLFSVDYTNELDVSKKYRTFMENLIHKDSVRVLKSEMLDLVEEEQ